jgi:Zn finger protein HypA/HybF involved in hydrogenase expression
MASLLKLYTDYNDRLKAQGIKLIEFACPCCAEKIETRPAPRGEEWDSLAQCPHCDAMYTKITEGATAHGLLVQVSAA